MYKQYNYLNNILSIQKTSDYIVKNSFKASIK